MIHNTHKGLMGMKRTHASDAWRVAAFLALSGGGRRTWLRAERYLCIIALFALGATLGSLAVPKLGIRAIWCSCVLLVVSFALMFEKRELEQESKTELMWVYELVV